MILLFKVTFATQRICSFGSPSSSFQHESLEGHIFASQAFAFKSTFYFETNGKETKCIRTIPNP